MAKQELHGIFNLMPNVVSADKRRLTYLENRHVAEWLEAVARNRGTGVAVPVREATSAYFAAHQSDTDGKNFSQRAARKSARRRKTARQIAQGKLSPAQAQRRHAPLPEDEPVRVVDLWSAVRRRASRHGGES